MNTLPSNPDSLLTAVAFEALDHVGRGFPLTDRDELYAIELLRNSMVWHPVETKLPDTGTPVLVRFKTFDRGNPYQVAYHSPNGWFLPQSPDGRAQSRNRVFGVTHWKPIT